MSNKTLLICTTLLLSVTRAVAAEPVDVAAFPSTHASSSRPLTRAAVHADVLAARAAGKLPGFGEARDYPEIGAVGAAAGTRRRSLEVRS